MKKVLALTGLLMIPLVFSSCASVTRSKISFYDESFKDKNDVIIYVYRIKSLVGLAVPWNVKLDEKVVAVLRQNAYIALHANPGVHTIIIGDNNSVAYGQLGLAGSTAKNAVDMVDLANGTLYAKGNEVYYIRSKGFNVKMLPKEEALEELKNMKYDTGIK